MIDTDTLSRAWIVMEWVGNLMVVPLLIVSTALVLLWIAAMYAEWRDDRAFRRWRETQPEAVEDVL